MELRFRDIAFWGCAFKGATEVEVYYGWTHARPIWDGVGYMLFCAAIIYGLCFIYDRWRIVRRNHQ